MITHDRDRAPRSGSLPAPIAGASKRVPRGKSVSGDVGAVASTRPHPYEAPGGGWFVYDSHIHVFPDDVANYPMVAGRERYVELVNADARSELPGTPRRRRAASPDVPDPLGRGACLGARSYRPIPVAARGIHS
jgi:hypothetical protein